jgi:hypothetical protein
MIALQMPVATLLAWPHHEQCDVIAFLHEENRVLRVNSATGGYDWTAINDVVSAFSASGLDAFACATSRLS